MRLGYVPQANFLETGRGIFTGGGEWKKSGKVSCISIPEMGLAYTVDVGNTRIQALAFTPDQKVVAVGADGALRLLEPSNGKVLAQAQLELPDGKLPQLCVWKTAIAVAAGNLIVLVDLPGLSISWRKAFDLRAVPPSVPTISSMQRFGGNLAILLLGEEGANGDSLRFLNPITRIETTVLSNIELFSSMASDDKLLVAHGGAELNAIGANGTKLWQFRRERRATDVALLDRYVAFGGDRCLILLNRSDGTLAAEAPLPDQAYHILGSSSAIVVVTNDGQVIGFPSTK